MFVDTNVLVNSRIPQAPGHDTAREMLERTMREGEPRRISRQILREYLAVVTRPQNWGVPFPTSEAVDDIEQLIQSYELLEDGPAVTEILISLCREIPVGGRQIHDANIVATMLAHGEHRLLTFNTGDFRRYSNRIELVGN